MKPRARPIRNNHPLRRINFVLLCLSGFLLCNLVAGWLIWRREISGELAWVIQLLSTGVLAGLMVALFVLNRRALLTPIRSIAAWASHIRQGDFSARLAAGHSGLYALTDDLNRLAEWLESLAELKNRELLEQGARLKTQTHIVRLLYDISGDFSHNATADELLGRTLRPMAEVLEARRIEFYRFDGDDDEDDDKTGSPQPVAAWDGGDGGDDNDHDHGGGECVKIPLRLGKNPQVECHIWFAAERFPLPDEFSQLLYTLGRNIGLALERLTCTPNRRASRGCESAPTSPMNCTIRWRKPSPGCVFRFGFSMTCCTSRRNTRRGGNWKMSRTCSKMPTPNCAV